MKCKHYMLSAPTAVIDTAPLSEALAIMIRKHMQDLMVVNAAGQFVGTVKSFMFSKMLLPAEPQLPDDAENESAEDVDNRFIPYLHRKVADFAVSHPVVSPEAPLSEALVLLSEGYIRLPVVDEHGKLVGALSSLTILRRFRF